MSERIPKRADVPAEYKWKLEDIYPTDSAWEEDFAKMKALPDKLASYKGQLCGSAEKLYEYLEFDSEISVLFDSIVNYAQRRSDEDTAKSEYQDMLQRVEAACISIARACAFVTPELLSIPDDVFDGFYKAQPKLELYRLSLDRIRRQREHVLSEAEEDIMALAGKMTGSPDNIFSMLNDADMKFPDAVDKDGNAHQVTHGSFIPLMQSEDRVLRKSAFESLYHVYEGYKNTFAAILLAETAARDFRARARKYSSTLEAALYRTEVPVKVYEQLIKAVNDNLPYMHRYVKLRKKLLGVEELHAYDLYCPIVADVDMQIPFEQAKQEVYDSLAPMGETYRAIYKEGCENGWIDIYENEGKRSGAYSAGARVHPYVLLNHKDTLNCEFTLAHEMGHAIHSYLSNKTQPVPYADYVIFVAEVASTCNESLLMQHLLKTTTDKKRRAYLINYFLEQFRTTLYRQTMFAEFELIINRRMENAEPLTADIFCEIYRELNLKYYGEDIVIDSELDMEWARIPHFYYNYYVYQYATGFSAAIALSQRILNEGEQAVKDYIGFLSGGCSTDPISLLKGAGVDMTSEQPVNDALAMFNTLLDEMEELVG